jgi:hypothetical protein
VFNFEDRPNVISIPYAFEILRNTLHIWYIHRVQRVLLFIQPNATLGINGRFNETLGITVELEITCLTGTLENSGSLSTIEEGLYREAFGDETLRSASHEESYMIQGFTSFSKGRVYTGSFPVVKVDSKGF